MRGSKKDTQSVPQHEIVVLVVNDRGNAPVGVVLDVLEVLLFVLSEVEVDGMVGGVELLENNGDFPVE